VYLTNHLRLEKVFFHLVLQLVVLEEALLNVPGKVGILLFYVTSLGHTKKGTAGYTRGGTTSQTRNDEEDNFIMIEGVMTSIVPKPLYGEPKKQEVIPGDAKADGSKAL